MHGLTTAHGTVLAFDRSERRVVHRPPGDVAPADLVLIADLSRPIFGVLDASGAWLPIDVTTTGPSRSLLPRAARVEFGGGLASFRFEGGHLTLPPDGHIRADVHVPHDWERFGLLRLTAMTALLELCRTDWLRIDTRERFVRHDIALASPLTVRLGRHLYDLTDEFAVHRVGTGRRRTLLFREGWKVDALVEYRPLVYFVLMGGGAYVDQLALAAESLLEFGHYDGDVLVITDRGRDAIEAAVPPALHGRLSILPVVGADKVDAVLARLMLGEHPGASGYAPILYSDTDVVFDRPLAPFLEGIRLGETMSAQSEHWNELPASTCCGAELFAADPMPIRHVLGFNAGVWAMPGGPDSVEAVDAIRRAVTAYLHKNGRDSLPWLDQAMANYVLRKLDAFDPEPMTSAVRLAQDFEPITTGDRRGFVHFWSASHRADHRAHAMADYVARLRGGQEPARGRGAAASVG